jgi:hypothetical protein
LIAVPLVGYLAIMGSSYAAGNTLVGLAQFLGIRFDAGGSYFVLVIMAGLIGGGIGALVFGLKAMLRGALSVVLIVCALISLSNAWGVTQVRPSDPRELLWGPTATALDVRDMVTAIEAASVRNTGFSRQSSLTYALPQDDPVLLWYLRRFLNVTDSVIPNLPSTVIVTPEGVQPSVPGTNYVGAKFPVRTVWDQLTLPPENWLKWWLYRETPQPVNVQETIVIWVQPK